MQQETEASKTPEKPHVSFSEIQMFTRCQYQWYYRYALGKKRAPAVAMIVGTSVHTSAEANLMAKLQRGELLTCDEAMALARDTLTIKWEEEEPTLDEEDAGRDPKAVKGEAIDKAVRLAKLHAVELAPQIEPTAVEQKFRIEVADAPHDIVGTIDVKERVKLSPKAPPLPNSIGIRDLKTTGKSPSADDAERDLQLSVYALAIVASDGRVPDVLRKDFLVNNKTPKLVVLETKRDAADLTNLMERIRVAIRAMQSGIYIPTDPGNWWCSDKWCGYYDECPFGRKKTVTVPLEGLRKR